MFILCQTQFLKINKYMHKKMRKIEKEFYQSKNNDCHNMEAILICTK